MAKKKTNKTPVTKKQPPKRTSKKAAAITSQTNLIFERNTRFGGDFNFSGRDTITHVGFDKAQVAKLFDQLYKDIDSKSKSSALSLEDLKAEVREIQSKATDAAKKNEKVDEGFLARRFRNIARMAPDLLDVVVKTLVHPMLGIGEVAKKIAEKAKEEAKS